MNPAEYVIKLFGGVRPLARIIGKSPSAISCWRKNRSNNKSKAKGNIPSSVHIKILNEAKKRGLDVNANDLVFGREVK